MKLSAYDAEVYEALRKPDIFADLYNGTVFQGKQVLRPEMLQYANEKEQLLAEDRMGNPAILYRIRDASRNCSLSDGLLRVVLNVEGQRSVHYGMPVRILMYDAITYVQEAKELEAQNRSGKKLKQGGEFLTGLRKGDQIMPVLTLVFYYGEQQEWDGPVSLHEMLHFPEELKVKKDFFPDYKINLVSSKTVNKDNFRTGLREVFELLEVMGRAERLARLMEDRKEHYSHLDADRAWLVARFLDIPLLKERMESEKRFGPEGGKEKIDMCTAIQEMMKSSEAKGEERGEARINQLNLCLIMDHRLKELERAAREPEYQSQLLREYKISR